jgi:hypothetical protein
MLNLNKLAKLLNANKNEAPIVYEAIYGAEIERRIRKRYSLSAELAILRQRDTKPEEFAAYNAFAEECKAEVKKMFQQGGN